MEYPKTPKQRLDNHLVPSSALLRVAHNAASPGWFGRVCASSTFSLTSGQAGGHLALSKEKPNEMEWNGPGSRDSENIKLVSDYDILLRKRRC